MKYLLLVLSLFTIKLLFKMANELDNLKAQVQKDTDVTTAASTLLQGLKTALDAAIASNDMSQVQALSDQIGANDTALAAAITANTPAGAGTGNTVNP